MQSCIKAAAIAIPHSISIHHACMPTAAINLLMLLQITAARGNLIPDAMPIPETPLLLLVASNAGRSAGQPLSGCNAYSRDAS